MVEAQVAMREQRRNLCFSQGGQWRRIRLARNETVCYPVAVLEAMVIMRGWTMYKRSSMLALIILLLLACGPVEQPGPEGGDQLPAAPESEATPTPTPESPDEAPTDFLPPEPGFPPPPPVPTLKYPNLHHRLDKKAVEADEARDAGRSSTTDNDPHVEVTIIFAGYYTTDNREATNVETVATWVRDNGGQTHDVTPSFIYATVPTSLLGELSQQEGVIFIDDEPYQTAIIDIPLPTLKYPNLVRKLDRKAVEADEARDTAGQADGIAGQSDAIDTGPFVEVSIGMDTNPDDAVTQTVVDWLRNNGVSPTSVSGRAERYGDGSFIRATVPTSLLGELSQQEGVIIVADTSHERPDPVW